MVNLNALTNITPLEMNNSIVTNGSIIQNTIDTTNSVVPFWFMTAMVVLYLVLVWYLFRQQDLVRLDILQSHIYSSFIVTIISYAILASSISTSILPLTFFGVLWLVSLIGSIYAKR